MRSVLVSLKAFMAAPWGPSLKPQGFTSSGEITIKVWYGPWVVGKHRLDLVVDYEVIIEPKANRGIIPVHVAQLRSYLSASSYPLGLILNFGLMELQWERIERDSRESYLRC